MNAEDQRAEVVRHWQKGLLSVLVPLLSCVVSLVVLELGLRIVGYRPVLENAWYLKAQRYVTNKDIVMIEKEMLSEEFYQAPPEKTKIVTLGDSFTDGYPVSSKYAYPVVLERLLAKKGWDVHLTNAGIGNSGTDQQLRLFKQYILPKLNPDIVVWAFYPNDIWDNVTSSTYTISPDHQLVPVSATTHWLYRRQSLYRLFPFPEGLKKHSCLFHLLLKSTEGLRNPPVPERYNSHPELWGLKKISLAIEEMNTLAVSHNFQMYYVLIAPQSLYLEVANTEKWKDS